MLLMFLWVVAAQAPKEVHHHHPNIGFSPTESDPFLTPRGANYQLLVTEKISPV